MELLLTMSKHRKHCVLCEEASRDDKGSNCCVVGQAIIRQLLTLPGVSFVEDEK